MPFIYATLLGPLVFVVVMIIALTYMGGKIFRIPEWEAYFSVELYNLVIAIIIVVAAFGVFEASKAITMSVAGAEPIQVSKTFLSTVTNKGVLPMYKDLLSIEAATAFSNAFMLRVGPSVWSWAYKVEPGADAILAMTRLMGTGLLAIYGSLSIQYIGLSFIEFTMPIILSIGLLLFIFPPTRDAGAFLIAFAFAFQTIFPLTYALNKLAFDEIWASRYSGPYDPYTPEIFGWQTRGWTKVFVFLAPFASTVNFPLLIPFINAMAHLTLIALVFPAISITITVAFINSITKFIRGKI